jgi:hypothetical protein
MAQEDSQEYSGVFLRVLQPLWAGFRDLSQGAVCISTQIRDPADLRLHDILLHHELRLFAKVLTLT